MKKGYILVRISITDLELFQKYPPLSSPAMEKYGGKYIIRGGKFEIAEGKWPAERTTLVEFENFEKAKACYESIEYGKAKEIRQKSTSTDLILIEGC
tara:strand:+ start:563 stop:853 length:291 start_codon:yes stop_codon:yes gene_type:complete